MKRDPDFALGRYWGGGSAPALDREGRVELLAEVFRALIEGRQPSREAALFAGAGGMSWLQEGGNLTRDYWKTSAIAGSHRTEAQVWRDLSSRGRQARDAEGTMQSANLQEQRE